MGRPSPRIVASIDTAAGWLLHAAPHLIVGKNEILFKSSTDLTQSVVTIKASHFVKKY